MIVITKSLQLQSSFIMTKAKTSQNNKAASIDKPGLLDYFDEGQVSEWLMENGKNIFYILAGVIGIIILTYLLSNRQSNQAEQEYIQAANDFTYFTKTAYEKNSDAANESLKRLQNTLSQHPELHAAYDGAIAQILLNRGEINVAQPYAQSTLARVKSDNLPYYFEYANNTLLISQKKFKEALENALSLQQKMKEAIENQASEKWFGDELFALNLLRIAMLQQEQKNPEAELQTWQEWKHYAGLGNNTNAAEKVNPYAFRSVIQQLASGSFSLPDYISYRENILKK